MAIGHLYYQNKTQNENEPKFSWDLNAVPTAKKGFDETLTTKVGYNVTYLGPVNSNAYADGITSPVQIEQDGTTYNGSMTFKLTKIVGDPDHVHFRITFDIPQLDSKPMTLDTKDLEEPATIQKMKLGQYRINAMKVYTDNDKFNSTTTEGERSVYDILSGTASLSFYRIPGETAVDEISPVKTQGMTMNAMASRDNIHLDIEAPIGTSLNIALYDMQGRMVQQLGAAGMSTNSQNTTLDYAPAANLASGAYLLVVESSQGVARQKILISE